MGIPCFQVYVHGPHVFRGSNMLVFNIDAIIARIVSHEAVGYTRCVLNAMSLLLRKKTTAIRLILFRSAHRPVTCNTAVCRIPIVYMFLLV